MSGASGACPLSATARGRRRRAPERGAAALAALAALLVVLLLPTALAPPPSASHSRPSALGSVERGVPTPPPLAQGGAWTTFHGSENRTGYFPGPGPSSSLTNWIACPSKLPLRVGPVLNASLLFVIDDFGTVYALDRAHNGSVVWSQSVGGTPTAADLAGGTLVVGASNGYVSGLVASTGGVLWRASVGAPVVQGVAVDNGTIFAGTASGQLVALSLFDGTRLWSVPLGDPVAGAPSISGGTIYVVTSNATAGALSALDEAGALRWTRPLPAPVDSAAAVDGGEVVVADLSGNVSAFSSGGGAELWRTGDGLAGDRFESTPALAPTGVYAASDLGRVIALDRTNGSLRWSTTVVYSGYRVLASPVATPSGVYLVDAGESLDDFTPGGRLVWQTSLGESVSYAGPAADVNTVYATNDLGCVYEFGSTYSGTLWPVTGLVEDASGRPVGGATALVGSAVVTSRPDGTFTLDLPNGTYRFTIYANGFLPLVTTEVLSGPTPTLVFRLTPLPLFSVTGVVEDAYSGRGIAGENVTFAGPYGFYAHRTTDVDGRFAIALPNGSIAVSVPSYGGYEGVGVAVEVDGGLAAPLVLRALPSDASVAALNPGRWDVALPLAAIALGAAAVGFGYGMRREQVTRLRADLASPLSRFVVMRGLLIVPQALVILTVLYLFGTYFPEVIHGVDFCASYGSLCSSVPFGGAAADLLAFGNGWGTFVVNLFTGNWGYAKYNNLDLPATQYLAWWLPNSLQIAVVALPLSALLAYPLGLLSGWRRDSAVDWGVRMGSLIGLLLPSFLVVLLLLSPLYAPFTQTFGDTPYGVLPTPTWFATHGGEPAWIGIGSNTTPTGFPLVDGALHGAWSFELLVLAKVLLQAVAIAALYAAIYLRFARNAVAGAANAPYILAARARGVRDHDLLWRHTSRRALPIFVLIFGLTLPVYIGTQAVVEAMFSDQGVGTLLLGEMTRVQSTAFGFASASAGFHIGNFYQVTIFLLVLIVLFGNLCADVLARLLDPRVAVPRDR